MQRGRQGRTFRSLQNPNFRRYAAGQLLSNVGTWMQLVAIGLLVLDMTDSGTVVGLNTAVQFLPILLLGAWAGVLADRRDRLRLMLGLNAVGAVVAAAFAVLVLTDRAELWSVFLLTVAAGAVTALENPSRRVFVTDLVGVEETTNAVALNSTLVTSSKVVGPALAGALIAGPGIGWCFAVNAVSYIPQLFLLRRIDRSKVRPAERIPKAKHQLRDGLRYVWGDPELRLPIVLMAAVSTLTFNYTVTLPLLATRDLDGGPATYTLIFAVMSLGSVAGALIVARRIGVAGGRSLGRSAVGLGVATVLLAAAPTTLVACVVAFPAGIGSTLVISGSNATLQVTAKPAMRGRVMALMSVVFLGSTPLGGPVAGLLGEQLGARWALLVGGLASVGAGALVVRSLRSTAARPAAEEAVDPAPIDVPPVDPAIDPVV